MFLEKLEKPKGNRRMLLLQTDHHLLSFNFPFSLSRHHNPSLSPLPFSFSPLISLHRPTSFSSLSALSRAGSVPLPAQVPEPTTLIAAAEEEGPIELPPSSSSIFSTTDDPSSLQVATSVLLTGAISIFLFRSLRRRAKRAKELKFRSSGSTKSLKEEALDYLKSMGSASIEANSPPSPVQVFLGALSAGVIALILYKFTTTIEAFLNRRTISDNFSVRRITITIRTVINGSCYLATFVFGINSIGLFLYSGQLAINSFTEGVTSEENGNEGEDKTGLLNSAADSSPDSIELNSSSMNQNSDDK